MGARHLHGRATRPASAERLPRSDHGMSLKVLADECIGCGGCEYACPTGALTKTDSFLGLFAIDAYTCDDCGQCVPKCPVDAIVVDPEWPTCYGHGCPLSSTRLQGVQCNI